MPVRSVVGSLLFFVLMGCAQSAPESKILPTAPSRSAAPVNTAANTAATVNQAASTTSARQGNQTASETGIRGTWMPTGIVTDGYTLSREQMTQYGKAITLSDESRNVQPDAATSIALTRAPVDYSKNVLACGYVAYCAKARVTIDTERNPNWIDLAIQDGPWMGKTSLGIYELHADKLTLCLAKPDTARPDAFASYYGNSRILTVYERQR